MYPLPITAFIDGGLQRARLRINGRSIITDEAIVNGSFSLDRYSSSAIAMELGNVTAAELNFTVDLSVMNVSLKRGDEIDGEIFIFGDAVELTDASGDILTTANGTELVAYDDVTKVKIGKFYITSLVRGFNTISVTALDSMIMLDEKADISWLPYPITASTFLNSVYENVVIDSTVYDATLQKPVTVEELTYRQVLSKVCECMGANAYYDWDGNLHIGWYGRESQGTIGRDRRTSSEKTEQAFKISKVEILDDAETNVDIDGTNIILRIVGNPFLVTASTTERQAISRAILDRVGNVLYYGGYATTLSMPMLYPMDTVDFDTGLVPLTHVTIGLNANTVISGDITTDDNNYNFGVSKAIKTAQTVATTAQETAQTAEEKADTAQQTADQAQETATTAEQKADTAQQTAEQAQESADQAQGKADIAYDRASSLYGTSSTASAVQDKVVYSSGFSLYDGATIRVTFTNANTASAPTMNVNNTGSIPITAYGQPINADSPYTWDSGAVVDFVYDGTTWAIANVQALKEVTALDSELVGEGVFNRLTNNGQVQGISWEDDNLYINGEYIKANTFRGDKIYGGIIRGLQGNLVIDLENDTIYYDAMATQEDIADLQEQIDGARAVWSYSGVPTLSNEPAVNWTTTTEKDRHIGNLYVDIDTGYEYKFVKDGNVYEWVKISNSEATQALVKATEALQIANAKGRVFIDTPTVPYSVGDLWFDGKDILTCTTAKQTGSFNANDWTILNDYTTDVDFQTTHTWNSGATKATFTAKVYKDGMDVTSDYRTDQFKWYLRNEDTVTETQIAIGLTCEVNASDLGYGSTVIGQLTTYEECYLVDRSGNPLTTKTGINLTGFFEEV